jgi:hypothetical protein
MSTIEEPTGLEKVSGSTVIASVMSLISAVSGNPIAALLPVLTSSLASGRHKTRVEKALKEIDANLREHEEQLRNLNDAQYRLLNEAIVAVLQTTDEAKLNYLRRAVENSLALGDLEPHDSVMLSRIIRDISAEEVKFLLDSFQYERIALSDSDDRRESNVLQVRRATDEEKLAIGLFTLGVLSTGESTYGDMGRWMFTPIVAKLIALLKGSPESKDVAQ